MANMVFSSEPGSSVNLAKFTNEYQLDWLCKPTVEQLQAGSFSLDKVDGFHAFLQRVDHETLNHPAINFNEYCNWFRQGEMPCSVVKDFLVQFSVFSNLFMVAQLKKMLNADTLEGLRASTEILANEVNEILNSPSQERATHFEWLVKMGESLGLSFSDMGKRHHGSVSTLFFCDELSRLYGDRNSLTVTAASYAVDSWAAAGFWDQLIEGLVNFKERNNLSDMPLVSFTSHSKFESNHAHHGRRELEGYYFTHDFDEDAFIIRSNEMLDGVKAFWDGLERNRKAMH
ncbi:MAG: hypothetical protein JKY24_09065 [Pseudomonadales bacterium]|nr:hypothetical protein [Pseudomonadales bacterium]